MHFTFSLMHVTFQSIIHLLICQALWIAIVYELC